MKTQPATRNFHWKVGFRKGGSPQNKIREFENSLSYRFLIHSFPLGGSVYVQNAPTITTQMLKKIAIISIYVSSVSFLNTLY